MRLKRTFAAALLLVALTACASPAGQEDSAQLPSDLTACQVGAGSKFVQPLYPESAQTECHVGIVELALLADRDGRVSQARVSRSSGWSDLDASAVRAAFQWTVQPKGAGGWCLYRFAFQLRNSRDLPISEKQCLEDNLQMLQSICKSYGGTVLAACLERSKAEAEKYQKRLDALPPADSFLHPAN